MEQKPYQIGVSKTLLKFKYPLLKFIYPLLKFKYPLLKFIYPLLKFIYPLLKFIFKKTLHNTSNMLKSNIYNFRNIF